MFRLRHLIILLFMVAMAACVATTPTQLPTQSATQVPTQAPTQSPPLLRDYLDPQTYLDRIDVGGQERLFMVHVPTGYESDHAVPLVFNLHGAGSKN